MEWINTLLSGESGSGVQLVLITLGLVVALILIFWLFRRIAGTPARRAARNRVPRLSITDVTAVDDKRFLVLARRDNVEHLVLIGGPTDVVVETGIIRAKQAQPQTGKVPQKEQQTQPAPQQETVQNPKPVEEQTDLGAAAAATTAAVATSAVVATEAAAEVMTDTASDVSNTISEAISAPQETPVAEPEVEVESPKDTPVVAMEEPTQAAEPEIQIAESDVALNESDLEASLSDALSSEELTEELQSELNSPEVEVESTPQVTQDDDSNTSPDDEMQKLLEELASETKEPA